MNRDTPPARRSNPRCTLCNHPDRDDIDRDLALGSRTQAEIAKLVGIHPSAVSRHYRSRAQPRLAMTGGVDVDDTPIGDLVTEHDRLYRITLGVLAQALARDDLRLVRDMIAEARKQQAGMTELRKAIQAGKIHDASGPSIDDVQAARASFKAKLDELASNYRRGPSILEMIDAMEAGADQDEINRLMRKASRPPESVEPVEDPDPDDQAELD
jgi:AcrR family transcriptional regulator